MAIRPLYCYPMIFPFNDSPNAIKLRAPEICLHAYFMMIQAYFGNLQFYVMKIKKSLTTALQSRKLRIDEKVRSIV